MTQLSFVRRGHTLEEGRIVWRTTDGRYRIVRATHIQGVVIDRKPNGQPRTFWHACKLTQQTHGPRNGTCYWDLLSTHRTRCAAELAILTHAEGGAK